MVGSVTRAMSDKPKPDVHAYLDPFDLKCWPDELLTYAWEQILTDLSKKRPLAVDNVVKVGNEIKARYSKKCAQLVEELKRRG